MNKYEERLLRMYKLETMRASEVILCRINKNFDQKIKNNIFYKGLDTMSDDELISYIHVVNGLIEELKGEK